MLHSIPPLLLRLTVLTDTSVRGRCFVEVNDLWIQFRLLRSVGRETTASSSQPDQSLSLLNTSLAFALG